MSPSDSNRTRSSIEELAIQSRYVTEQLPFEYFSDSLSEYVAILNRNRQIIFCNQPMVEYLNAVDRNELIGKRPGEAFHCSHAINNSGGCGTTEFCRMCGANKAVHESTKGTSSTEECRIVTDPGAQAYDLLVHASPLVIKSEPFTIFSMKDIGSEKRRSVLENIFFHDILNVVGGLAGYSELLRDASDEERREYTGAIGELVEDLQEQIRMHQELMKAEHHELEVHPTVLSTGSLLASVVTAMRKHSSADGRTIEIVDRSDDMLLISDETLLRRVLINLVKNALEATDPGGVVTVGFRRNGTAGEFTVRNSGVMPVDVQLQIFQRSFSTKGSGRGLGTYSVKLLTEQYLEGRVSFVSNPDDGTVFTVSVPIRMELPAKQAEDLRKKIDEMFA